LRTELATHPTVLEIGERLMMSGLATPTLLRESTALAIRHVRQALLLTVALLAVSLALSVPGTGDAGAAGARVSPPPVPTSRPPAAPPRGPPAEARARPRPPPPRAPPPRPARPASAPGPPRGRPRRHQRTRPAHRRRHGRPQRPPGRPPAGRPPALTHRGRGN